MRKRADANTLTIAVQQMANIVGAKMGNALTVDAKLTHMKSMKIVNASAS